MHISLPILLLAATIARADTTVKPVDYPPVACKHAVAASILVEDGDRGYDVVSYELDLRVDPDDESISGTVTLICRLVSAELDSLRLDLVSDLTVDRVMWDNLPQPFLHQDDKLVIPVPATARDDAKVAITYGGHPPRHGELFMGLVFRNRGPSPTDQLGQVVFNISQPSSSHAWWPCKDHPADKALVRSSWTIPDTLQVVSNGLLLLDEPVEDSWHRVTWASVYPMPPYLVGVSIGEFVESAWPCATEAGSLPLTTHVYPENAADAEVFFAPTCDMLTFLESIAGPWPFPAERYGQMAIKWGGAMEHQTSTSFGSSLISADGMFHNIIVHELAHQWFGDAMTPSEWSDIWLSEGFARYCEALWVESTEGHAAYLDFMDRIGPRRHPDLFANDRPLADPSPILTLVVYDKGAWLLHMLRAELGDMAFFGFLRDYATAADSDHVVSGDVIAAAGRAAGRDMTSWFRPWLETSVVPRLAWSLHREYGADGPHDVLTLSQLQDGLFELRVPMQVVADGDTTLIHVDLREATAVVDLNRTITAILPDPLAPLLATFGEVAAPVLSLAPPFPNPSADGDVELRYTLRQDSPVSIMLHDARGRRLALWDLGSQSATADPRIWRWNGLDDRQRSLPSGVYWFVIEGAGERVVERITLTR